MNNRRHLFTSESVAEGHPDKIADQISDAILDAFLAEEPEAKVACETFVADNLVVIAGEFKTARKALFSEIQGRAEEIARQVLRDIGYRDAETGIDPNTCEVQVRFNHQSIQIHKGIMLAGGDIGAGDQGLMFGYACDETPDLMPYPIWLAHRLVKQQAELRKSGALPWLRPDAKSQVTVAYEDQRVAGIENVVISTQIERDLDPAWVTQEITREIIDPLVPMELRSPGFKLWVNPAGPIRNWRPEWRHRPHRPQDHRRYLWRLLSSRRRRIFRKRSYQGGSLSRLYGQIYRQKPRRGGLCQALSGAVGVCHRRGRTGLAAD